MDGFNETLSSLDYGNESEPGSERNFKAVLLLKLFIALLFALGLAGNSIMVCSIFKSPKLNKKVSTKFSANMLISSALSCLVAMTLNILATFKTSESKDELDSALEYLFYVSITFGVVHHYASCVLSLTRLTAMMWPIKYKALETHRKRTNLALFMVWMCTILGNLPLYFGILGIFDPDTMSIRPYPDDTNGHKIGRILYGVVICTSPVFIESVAYTIMYMKMSKARRASANQKSDENKRTISQWQSGVTRALLASIVVTSFCNTPYTVCSMINAVTGIGIQVLIPLILHALQHPLLPAMFYIFAVDYREAVNHLFNNIFSGLSLKCFQKKQGGETSSSTQRTDITG